MLEEVEDYDFRIVKTASNGKLAIDMMEKEPFDVVFMDVEMPVMNGVEATKQITLTHRGAHIIVMSFHSQLEKVIELINNGARNYIVKDNVNKDTIKAALDKIFVP